MEMKLLTGEYRNTLDEKGRILFPVKLRNELFSNNEEQVYNLVNFDDYDGVIVIASSFGAHPELLDKFLDRIKSECNIPIVSIGEMEGIHNTTFSDAHSSICEKLTDHLIEEHKFLLRKLLYLVTFCNCQGIIIKDNVTDNDLSFVCNLCTAQ